MTGVSTACFVGARIALLLTTSLSAAVSEAQRSTIDQVTGVKGAYTADEDVYRVNFPRNDVKVSVEGRSMHPFLGLTSWAAFTPHSQTELMVMGDLPTPSVRRNTILRVAGDTARTKLLVNPWRPGMIYIGCGGCAAAPVPGPHSD